MKKIIIFAAALSVFAACSKSFEAEEPVTQTAGRVKVTADVTTDAATKVALDGLNLNWEAGDLVKFRWGNTTYGNNFQCDTIKYINGASFQGEISSVGNKGKQHIYAYYSTNGQYTSTGSVKFRKPISASQTGMLDDLKDQMFFYSWVKNSTIKFVTEGGDTTGVTFNTTIKPMFSVLKLNIAESLGVTSIVLSTDADIAGVVEVLPARTWGTIGSNDFLYRNTALTQGKSITVTNGGSILKGDVYIVIAPDAYDSDKKEYCSSASYLEFTFNYNGGVSSVTKTLAGKIYNGSVKNLGSVTALEPEAEGTLCLLPTTPLSVSVTGASEGADCYYETAATVQDCKIPTTSSSSFTIAEGFQPDLINEKDSIFIRVLIKNGSGSKIVSAYLKNWNFTSGSAISDALNTANADLPSTGNKKGVNGLLLWRRATAAFTATVSSDNVTMNNSVVPMMKVYNNCNAFVYCGTISLTNYNIGFNLSYSTNGSGISRTNNYKSGESGVTNNTFTSVVKSNPAARAAVVWDLGTAKPGYLFAFTQDRAASFYNTAILEVL